MSSSVFFVIFQLFGTIFDKNQNFITFNDNKI